MSASNKLIELYKTEPLLKGIELTEKNIKDAVFYVDEVTNCESCTDLACCKNKIVGIKPEFNGESITYKSCQFALIEQKKRNVYTLFASNYIMDASLEDFDLSTSARAKALEYRYSTPTTQAKCSQAWVVPKWSSNRR